MSSSRRGSLPLSRSPRSCREIQFDNRAEAARVAAFADY